MPHRKEEKNKKTGDDPQDPKEKFDKAFEEKSSVAKSTDVKKGKSKIAQIGILHILNQMKNPLTNIMLCVEIMESRQNEAEDMDCAGIIRNSAKALENSIRDLVNSFNDLGISVHLDEDNSPV